MGQSLRYALFLFAAFPVALGAQGFGIFEQGACAMGRAGTGAAAPCADGSAMFFNPAGLAGLKGGRATVGVTLLDVQGAFTDDIFQAKTSLDDPLIAVPQVYISYGATSKLGIGVGLFAPYGLETQWPLAFDGRFAGYKNILQSVYIQPTIAYQVTSGLSVGGGLDIVLGKVELNQRLDLADAPVPLPGVPLGTTFSQFGIAPGTDFADVHLEATKTTVAAHFGAIYKVTDRLSLGANFLTQAKFDYAGIATFTQVPTNLVVPADLTVDPLTIPAGCSVDDLLSAPTAACNGIGLNVFNTVFTTQPVTTTIKNPSQLTLGVAYKIASGWTVLGDYQHTWWNQFNELVIVFPQDLSGALDRHLYERYRNTDGFRLGAEWAKDAKWTVRGGYLYHGGAAPAATVTPLLPEGDRNEFTGGATIKLGSVLTADLAYQYIRQNDRRGRTREPILNQVPTTGLNNGLYSFHAHLFGVSLGYAF
ncbi:MAG TPA: outer membrane protein transport protein [Gemmatimonadales bacterium]|nr:outer membrane protein transport protein [Gemmatimonadales bacterium]